MMLSSIRNGRYLRLIAASSGDAKGASDKSATAELAMSGCVDGKELQAALAASV
jgi:hypothetical protein